MRGRFERLDVFLAVAETGGFTAAARRLDLTPGAVSQSVRALEQRHGVALFQRTTRRVALTDAGRELFERLRPVAAEVDEAIAALAGHGAGPRGRLRVTVPRAVVAPLVLPLLERLRAGWPTLAVEISVSDVPVDPVAEGFDAGIRLGDAVERDMVAVPLTGPIAWTLAATPALLGRIGHPGGPEALAGAPVIAFRYPGSRRIEPWDLVHAGRAVRLLPDDALCVDDRDLLLAAVRAGLGIGLVDRASIRAELDDGRLAAVLDGAVPDSPGLALYFPRRSQSQPKLRLLIDELRAVAAGLDVGR